MKKDIKLYSTVIRALLRLKYQKYSRCTVQEVIKKKIENGEIKNRKKRGKPTKLTKSINI